MFCMGSLNAQKFANKVSEKVLKGELVNLGKIAREVGYSESVAKAPSHITNTKTYRTVAKPLIEGLQSEIERVKLAMSKKDLCDEEYKVLVYSLDVLTKNYQLLSGGATERQVFVLPAEVLERNKIQADDEQIG